MPGTSSNRMWPSHNIATSANLSAQRMAQFKEGLLQVGESDLSNFLTDLATNVDTAGQAFQQFFQIRQEFLFIHNRVFCNWFR